MGSPTAEESNPAGAEARGKPSPITRTILESYLLCRTKALLHLHGISGARSDHEAPTAECSAGLKDRAAERLTSRHAPEEVLRGVTITEAALGAGASIILDAGIEAGDLALRYDALVKVQGDSRLGSFHYVPALFYPGEKVRQGQRQVLQALAVALGEVQGRHPSSGFILHGPGAQMTRVKLQAPDAQVSGLVARVRALRAEHSPPALTLNGHCQACEFRQRCRAQAEREDNVSLLGGLGEKGVAKLRRRGNTTVTQLSYTFRPRKRPGAGGATRPPHSFALQALAVREDKVFVLGEPELRDAPTRIYFDCEGDPERGFVYLIGVLIEQGARHGGIRSGPTPQTRKPGSPKGSWTSSRGAGRPSCSATGATRSPSSGA